MRFILWLAVLVAPVTAFANPEPIRLDAKTRGSTLELTFTNVTAKPLKLERRVSAGEYHYDWLTVVVAPEPPATGKSRTLQFTRSRRAAVIETVDLAANASMTESIDLLPWAVFAGEELHLGKFRLTVTWDASKSNHARFVGRASTVVSIVDAVTTSAASCQPSTTTTLSVLARPIAGAAALRVGIHNAGTAPVCIQTYHRPCIISSATITLTVNPGVASARVLKSPPESCDKTGIAPLVTLAPGATWWNRIDVPTAGLAKGTHAVEVSYTSKATNGWTGVIATRAVVAIP